MQKAILESTSEMQTLVERHQKPYFYLWASFYNFHLCRKIHWIQN